MSKIQSPDLIVSDDRAARMDRAELGASIFPELPLTIPPDGQLLKYYAIRSLLWGPLFPFLLIASYLRYRTLRYVIEPEGIAMRWGVLFRREVSLNYARIQDIHLTSNVVERWLGLGRIQVQTASGSASAEMTIEGLLNVDGVRDFLYSRMRGAGKSAAPGRVNAAVGASDGGDGNLAAVLREIASEVRELRHELGRTSGDGTDLNGTPPIPADPRC